MSKTIEQQVEEFADLIGCDFTGDEATECNWLRKALQDLKEDINRLFTE